MDLISLMDSASMSEINSLNSRSFYKSVCALINNFRTEIVYADHSDHTFIIATQYNKLGSLLTITRDQVETADNITEVVYTVKPVVGRENLEEQAAARFIAEKLDNNKDFHIFLSLKQYDTKVIKQIVQVLNDLKNK